ncbi:MAG: hypothetical protein Q8N09_06965 [Thermodesulfovibrionia bacterium]|nr:hypothetical protein [Thermodesulfovibrionia bacterium]
MKHKIIVPDEYANGRNQEAFQGTSDIERYIEAFERKWWAVMNSYAQDINNPKDVGFICSGTPAAVQGCNDGYDAAMKRVAEFLKDHKPNEVQKFIKENIGK